MAIIRWSPLDLLNDDFFADALAPGRPHSFSPAMDVYEDNDNVIVETPLPGIDPKDVKIEIEDNVLTVSGESTHRREVDEKNYYRREVRSGAFYRAVALPKSVQGDRASAAYDQGILKVTVPKAEAARPKRIAINVKST